MKVSKEAMDTLNASSQIRHFLSDANTATLVSNVSSSQRQQ
jgi:hypothetical protein